LTENIRIFALVSDCGISSFKGRGWWYFLTIHNPVYDAQYHREIIVVMNWYLLALYHNRSVSKIGVSVCGVKGYSSQLRI